jgi:hypothetical protein
MWLGKHYGKPFEEIDPGYLAWAFGNLKLDRDQRFTIECHLLGDPIDAEFNAGEIANA